MAYKNLRTMRRRQETWRRERQKFRNNWLRDNGPCSRCGESDFFELQAHYLDMAMRKEYQIWYWEETLRDSTLKQCSVLCKSCHKKFHRDRDLLPAHGTLKRYKHPRRPCRCIKCRKANTEYEAERLEKKRVKIRLYHDLIDE